MVLSAFFTLTSFALAMVAGVGVLGAFDGHPLLGMVGGIVVAACGLREAKNRHREGYNSETSTAWGEVMETYAPYTQLGYTLLTLLLMAIMGALGAAGGSALMGEAGQIFGALLGVMLGFICVVNTKLVPGDPGAHGNVHGRSKPETLEGLLDNKGVYVNRDNGIWLGDLGGSSHVRKKK